MIFGLWAVGWILHNEVTPQTYQKVVLDLLHLFWDTTEVVADIQHCSDLSGLSQQDHSFL